MKYVIFNVKIAVNFPEIHCLLTNTECIYFIHTYLSIVILLSGPETFADGRKLTRTENTASTLLIGNINQKCNTKCCNTIPPRQKFYNIFFVKFPKCL